jgi:hypothetical protein
LRDAWSSDHILATMPFSLAAARRAILFLINIGLPMPVGVLRGEPQVTIVGAVVGMLFTFADNDGALLSRLRLLPMDAGMLALGGVLGHLARDFDVAVGGPSKKE